MRISRLLLHNIGVYKGDCEFVFHTDAPVVLIGGMNGGGKTTILDSVLIALYGSASPSYGESSYTTYGHYLRAMSNASTYDSVSSILLEFESNEADAVTTIAIERKWDTSLTRIRERIAVRKDGVPDEFLAKNWDGYIEGIIPRALSRFFFFDGEKIAELAQEDNDSQLKDSIKALMGVTVVETLMKDLGKLSKRLVGAKAGESSLETLDELRQQVSLLEDEIASLDQRITENDDNIAAMTKTLGIMRSDLAAQGGGAIAERAKLEERHANLTERLESLRESAVAISAGAAPLVMLAANIEALEKCAKEEYDGVVIENALGKLEDLAIDFGTDEYKRETIDGFFAYIRNSDFLAKHETVYSPTEDALRKIETLIKDTVPSLKQDYEQIQRQMDETLKQIEVVENYLSIEIDEKAVERTKEAIAEMTEKLATIHSYAGELAAERSSKNGEYIKMNAAYKRARNEAIRKLDARDDGARTFRYIAIADDILDEFRKRLQFQKVASLSQQITDCYLQLASKKTLINDVVIDPENLTFSYFNNEGKTVDRTRLSAGEKQLLVISTLWALALCSGRKLPVIIDTPLARMDSAHRMSLVETYFPRAAEQTILLSTDSEIIGDYYNALKHNVSDEYTLSYDEKSKSTTILTGYFTRSKR